MKINKITQAIGAITLIGITMPALAVEQTGWYLGIGAGSARSTIAEQAITNDLLNSGYATTEFRINDKDFGYKIFGGYQFNQHIALEAGFFDFGEFNYTATTIPTGTKFGELNFQGWNLDLVGILPLTERQSLFARVGAHNSKATVNVIGTGAVNVLTPQFRERSTNLKVGIGYQYQVTDTIALRIEAERFRMDDAVGNRGDIDFLSVNVLYRFGGRSTSAISSTPVEPIAPAPTRPAPITAEYCSELTIQFEIANEDIQQADLERILVLATFLNKYPDTKVRIAGHSDNVGSDADNLRLSQQRAESVVNYLAQEHAIAKHRLTAVGYGDTQPIADNATESGKQANRRINALIDCATDIEGLQPLPARASLAMALEFADNESAIDSKYHSQLSSVAEYMRNNPKLTATIEGHTDNANPNIAQTISQERAQRVADYLVEHFAIDRSRLQADGFGATRRNAYNTTASGRQENRRVNIILTYPE